MIMKRLVILVAALGVLNTASSATNKPEDVMSAAYIFDMYTVDDTHCLALNIYHEARNESLAGQVAVADVTMNRVFDTRYPSSICGVVMQAELSEWYLERGQVMPVRNRCQFSWYCDGKSDEPKDGDSWARSQLIAQNFLTYGEFRGLTEGATHYHASYVSPAWIHDRGMDMVGSLGEHIFYRWN